MMNGNMMSVFNVGSMGGWFGVMGIILYITFWLGVAFLAYYIVTRVKEEKAKIYLVLGLILVLGSLFLAPLWGASFGGSMMRGGFTGRNSMMRGVMKEMLKDNEFRKDMREMMEEVEQSR